MVAAYIVVCIVGVNPSGIRIGVMISAELFSGIETRGGLIILIYAGQGT